MKGLPYPREVLDACARAKELLRVCELLGVDLVDASSIHAAHCPDCAARAPAEKHWGRREDETERQQHRDYDPDDDPYYWEL